MSEEKEDKSVTVRNAKGQFVRGVSGNPLGKPVGVKNQITKLREATELALRDYLADPAQQVKAMQAIDRVMDIAINGDEKAAVGAFKVLFDRLVPNVKQADPEDRKGRNAPVMVQIVNHTGDRNQKPVQIIDGEVEVVEPDEEGK